MYFVKLMIFLDFLNFFFKLLNTFPNTSLLGVWSHTVCILLLQCIWLSHSHHECLFFAGFFINIIHHILIYIIIIRHTRIQTDECLWCFVKMYFMNWWMFVMFCKDVFHELMNVRYNYVLKMYFMNWWLCLWCCPDVFRETDEGVSCVRCKDVRVR